MKQESLVVAKPKRRRYASYLGEISPAPANIINRDFQAAAPNEKWLTDITEFQIPAGKVYLSPTCANAELIGHVYRERRIQLHSARTPDGHEITGGVIKLRLAPTQSSPGVSSSNGFLDPDFAKVNLLGYRRVR